MSLRRPCGFARLVFVLVLIAVCDRSTAFAAVPTPWATRDIGAPALAGSASFLNGRFTIGGGGIDIWGTSDQFRFVYQRVAGDFQIVARVESLTQADVWSKAGVMIRSSLNADAVHGFVEVTAGSGVGFEY